MARVLLINYEYPPIGGGGGNATKHIALAMAAMGHEPFVLSARWDRLPHVDYADGVTIRRIAALRRRADRCSVPEMLAFMTSGIWKVPLLAQQWRIDAAVAFFTLPCAPIAWYLKRRADIPYAISLQGGDVPGFDPGRMQFLHSLSGATISHLWRDADAVIANSDGLATLAHRHDSSRAIDVIPAGADVAGMSAKTDYAARDGVNLLFVGRLVRQKGLDVLMSALATIELPVKWKVTLVGDGPEWTAIAGQASRLGIGHRLELRGWVAREFLAAMYREGDIFILPSRDEGMPNALLEAMACGLPVVATRIAGSVEAVVDGETGFLVPPEDSQALAGAITTLMLDETKRAAFGRAGRARVERVFGWDKIGAAWMKVIEKLIAGKETHVTATDNAASTDYDQIWSGGWDDMRRYGPMARHSRRLMVKMTDDLAPRSVLDVGCGEGSMLAALARAHRPARMSGIEISTNAVALARTRFPAARFFVGDIAEKALAETFDLVVCADVVEHIADDVAALSHMAAMCAPGGHVVVATLQGRMRRFEADIGHVRNYAAGELASKMRSVGLEVDREIAWGFPFYSPLYRDLLEVLENRGTMGRFGFSRKLMAHAIYIVFLLLNSARHGDYIFVRGRKS